MARATTRSKGAVDKDQLLSFYRSILLIRRFEERAGQLYGMGLLGGFCPPYTGPGGGAGHAGSRPRPARGRGLPPGAGRERAPRSTAAGAGAAARARGSEGARGRWRGLCAAEHSIGVPMAYWLFSIR